jgi:hypothetical protein
LTELVARGRLQWFARRSRKEDAVGTDPVNVPKTGKVPAVGLAAAAVVLIAFAVFVVFMVTEVGGSEIRWTRLAWLFASVEAIAFGAAGALFGSSIQRARAENAEAEARRNADDAAGGRALASACISDEATAAAGGGGDLETLGPGGDVGAALAKSRAELARDLFPDLAVRRP